LVVVVVKTFCPCSCRPAARANIKEVLPPLPIRDTRPGFDGSNARTGSEAQANISKLMG
jgi:hypothetical protein